MSSHGSFLAGLSVLDCSQNVGGNYAAQLLAELGADVSRPDLVGVDRSITSECPTTRQALRDSFAPRLPIGWADLVGKHFDIGIADSTHVLDTEGEVRAAEALLTSCRTRLVLSLSRTRSRDTSTLTPGALAGLNTAIGFRDREPLTLPFNIDQYSAAVNGVCAVIAAIAAGQEGPAEVTVDSADVLAWYVGMNSVMFAPYGRRWLRDGFRAANSSGCYPAAAFACADGYVGIYGRTVADWEAFKSVLGSPAWGDEERLRDPVWIAAHHADEVDALIGPLLASRPSTDVFAHAQRAGLAAAPVLTVPQGLAHPQMQEHGRLGRIVVGDHAATVPLIPVVARDAPTSAPPAEAARADAVRPLTGLRVVELCWVWAGPLIGSTLASLGAEVIKIEHPSRMDSSRLRGRPTTTATPDDAPEWEVVPYFHEMNHGKKSVSVDLRTEQGRADAFELLRGADVLIENMRPGALDRAGLGYENVVTSNPSIIYLELSATGRGGPLEGIRAYAPVLSSLAGLERSIGYPDGTVAGMMTHAFSDPNAGVYGLLCVLAALHHRRTAGRGSYLDMSQLDAVFSVMREAVVDASITDEQPPLRGSGHANIALYGHFPTADGRWVALCSIDEPQWMAVKDVVADPRLHDPCFDSERDRLAHVSKLNAILGEWSRGLDADEAAHRLSQAGVEAAVVLDAAAALDRAQRDGRTAHLTHPLTGDDEVWSLPWRFDGRFFEPTGAAPLLGADDGWNDADR